MFSVSGTSPYDGKKEIKDVNWGNGCIEVMQLCNIVSLWSQQCYFHVSVSMN